MRGPSCFDIERRQGLRILLFILTSAFNSFARSSPQAGLLLSDQTPVDVGSAEVHTERGEFRPARCAENYRGPPKSFARKDTGWAALPGAAGIFRSIQTLSYRDVT